MSIVSMVDNFVVKEKSKAEAGATGVVAPPEPTGVPANVINQLVAYVPTEVITIWVALIAVLHDPKPAAGENICQADWGTQWMLAAGAAALAMLLTLGFAYRKFEDTHGVEFHWPIFGMLAAPAAFLAWAIALPEGPLRSACWYTDEAGAVIVTIATVGIASLAYIFGQGSRFEKVPTPAPGETPAEPTQ